MRCANMVPRLNMCNLAVDQGSNWLMVDDWEATLPVYMPTAQVLDHFEHEINGVLGGISRPDGSKVPAKILLLAGADLIQTMSTPGKIISFVSEAGNILSDKLQESGLRVIWNICKSGSLKGNTAGH